MCSLGDNSANATLKCTELGGTTGVETDSRCSSDVSCQICGVSIGQVIGCEDRLRNDLYCVGWGVKLCSTSTSTRSVVDVSVATAGSAAAASKFGDAVAAGSVVDV